MTLLTIVKDALQRIKLAAPVTVSSSTDPNVTQMIAAVNAEGKMQAKVIQWQQLIVEKTFLTVQQEVQTDALPADFGNFVNGTFFNRSQVRQIIGPLTPQEYQQHQSLFKVLVYDQFRLRGNDLLFLPIPGLSETCVFEYVRTTWAILASDSSAVERMDNDADTTLLNEELLTQGAIWRFLEMNNFPYEAKKDAAEAYEATLVAKEGNGGRSVVNLARSRRTDDPRTPYVPEGSWNL